MMLISSEPVITSVRFEGKDYSILKLTPDGVFELQAAIDKAARRSSDLAERVIIVLGLLIIIGLILWIVGEKIV